MIPRHDIHLLENEIFLENQIHFSRICVFPIIGSDDELSLVYEPLTVGHAVFQYLRFEEYHVDC